MLVSTLHIIHDHIYPLSPASVLENPSDISHEHIAIIEAKSSSSQYISLCVVVPQAVLQVAAIAKEQK